MALDGTTTTLALGAAAWITHAVISSSHRAQERSAERRRQREERHRRACLEVLRSFHDRFGYLASDVVTSNEIKKWLKKGIDPDQLAELLLSRVAAVPGPLLGHGHWGDGRHEVRLPRSTRTKHMAASGKTGSGKSTLIVNLAVQDLIAGLGLAAISPEQEFFTEELLPLIPEQRWDDIIYVNPADTSRPVVLNPLQLDPGEDLDLKTAENMAVFERLCGDEGGSAAPRTQALLRHLLYSLTPIPGTTLLEMERLLDRSDDAFRCWVVSQLDDAQARHFWTRVYPAFPKDSHLPLLNRLSRFLRPRFVRALLCTPGKSLNVRQAMDSAKVILVNASDGLLGQENAEIVGQLFTAKLQIAAMSRADIPKHQRRPFIAYIDEFPFFCNIGATSYERMFSRCRKYGLGLVLAAQHLGQIPEHLVREILGNVGTVVAFQVGATDARRLARELVGELDGVLTAIDPKDLLSLRVGQAVGRIGRNVMRLSTEPPRSGGRAEVATEVICRSRERYGCPVEAGIGRDPRPFGQGPSLSGLDPEEAL